MMTNGLICFAHKAVVSGQILFFLQLRATETQRMVAMAVYAPHNKAAFHRFGHTLLLLLISVLKVICSSVCGKESKLNLGR